MSYTPIPGVSLGEVAFGAQDFLAVRFDPAGRSRGGAAALSGFVRRARRSEVLLWILDHRDRRYSRRVRAHRAARLGKGVALPALLTQERSLALIAVILSHERWQALSPLLDRALELEGGERQSWL